MTFRPAGEARLDLYTDAMLLDIGPDTFVVPLDRLADLTAHRRHEVAVSRRYWGDVPGKFRDVEQGIRLRRSKPGAALIFVERGTIYSIPVVELREVLHGVRSECGISRVLTSEARMMEVEA